jgi:dephospho-CoA kinase
VLTVGLTGNVAGGKTTVADRWRAAGIVVIDADAIGHELLRDDLETREALVGEFGPGVLDGDGSIDRSALGTAAFASPRGVDHLNAIVHPPLLERLDDRLEAVREAGEEVVVVDAALILEFNLNEAMDRIVLVTAPRSIRKKRLQAMGIEDERIEQVMAAQLPDAEKRSACDFIIENVGSLKELERLADRVLSAIRREIEEEAMEEDDE